MSVRNAVTGNAHASSQSFLGALSGGVLVSGVTSVFSGSCRTGPILRTIIRCDDLDASSGNLICGANDRRTFRLRNLVSTQTICSSIIGGVGSMNAEFPNLVFVATRKWLGITFEYSWHQLSYPAYSRLRPDSK